MQARYEIVIASAGEAIQTSDVVTSGLLRRFAPRNDEKQAKDTRR